VVDCADGAASAVDHHGFDVDQLQCQKSVVDPEEDDWRQTYLLKQMLYSSEVIRLGDVLVEAVDGYVKQC
jgi:hypothetical protein